MFQLQLFFLLHCDEWDRVVALPRHKFVTGATLLQLSAHVLSLTLMWPCYGIIIVGTLGVTNQSAAFDPHLDVGPVYIKTKRLQLRKYTLTRDQVNYTFEAHCN